MLVMRTRLEACAIYNNWWPMLSALMYVLVPMPCLFFGGGSTQFLTSRDGGGWIDAAKFLTGGIGCWEFSHSYYP
ncbi:LEPTIN RECEPTOR-RELATED [Salix purpurea]|uniref:LEPTIN RECEPTOR-RELATED n=1 Tax=Salix purpurea TaxID=77065 RepID=A0A9Q0Q1P0_SALPP|nr:LEPTIN RECEPTOR-RELATED [Salix purpurea]